MIVLKLLHLIICGWTIGVIINYLSDTLPVYNRRFRFHIVTNVNKVYQLLDYISVENVIKCGNPAKNQILVVNSGAILLIVYL